MLTFHENKSGFYINRDGEYVGYIGLYPEKGPMVYMDDEMTLGELKLCLEKCEELKLKPETAFIKKYNLEEGKKYRMTSPEGISIEFIPMTIDRVKNEIYIKITAPVSSHEGLVLSSIEGDQNTIEEIPMHNDTRLQESM
jgi:hypothetical protein